MEAVTPLSKVERQQLTAAGVGILIGWVLSVLVLGC